MSGGVHREVGKMKVWRVIVATVIILLSLTSCCTARLPTGVIRTLTQQTLGKAAKIYKGSEDVLAVGNAGAGIFTRSVGVGTAMQQMREEDEKEMSLSTQLAITTLAVSDVAGGVLLPVAQKIVDAMIQNTLLSAAKEAWKWEVNPPAALTDFISNADYRSSKGGQKAIRDLLVQKKVDIKLKVSTNLEGVLGNAGGTRGRLYRKITKFKKLFKVAKFAKALGPVFDVINIGMSTYSLVTTSMDCHKGPTCNVGGLVSASLGIVSGVLGIISLAVPFLAPLALIFGIAASLVEYFWTPPEPPLPQLHLREQLYDLNAQRMLNLDAFSRMQLQGVNTFLQQSGESIDHYIYVVNQGHLPNWMEENISDPEEKLSGPLTFGFNEKAKYYSDGIYKNQIEVIGQCTNMSVSFNQRSKDAIGSNEKRCDYFQEGNGDLIVNSKYDKVGTELYVGADFYGISQSSRHERNGGNTMYADTNKSKYKGVMVLVPTDRVTYRELRGEEGEETYTTPVRTRGLRIDTERRFRQQPGVTHATYDDVVAIGDMLNLGYKVEDGSHMVIVNTGNSGRDILIIDGWVKKLEARLGSNHNTLSFRTISRSKQAERRIDDSKKQDEIKGIKFNSGSGQVIMLGYDPVTEGSVEHDLGHVHGVGFLGASPFDDEITLFALQKDSISPNYHFSVYKFMGKATYIFDAKNHKSKRFNGDEVAKFKVLDASKEVSDDPETPAECEDDDAPLLKIINMQNNAQEADVQYKGNKVYIYKRDGTPYAIITLVTKCPTKVSATSEDGHSILQKEKRWMTELDIMSYEGRRYDHDFSLTPQDAAGENDIMYLYCPEDDVAEDMAVRNVETLVVGDEFFDDCQIGSNDDEADDGEDITVTVRGDTMRWRFPQQTTEEGSRRIAEQTFTGVKRIVNKYNKDIVTLSQRRQTFGLYAASLEVSGEDIVNDSNLGDPVKDNLKMCILRGANLDILKKRKAMKRDSPGAVEDLGPDYDLEELKDSCWKAGESPD